MCAASWRRSSRQPFPITMRLPKAETLTPCATQPPAGSSSRVMWRRYSNPRDSDGRSQQMVLQQPRNGTVEGSQNLHRHAIEPRLRKAAKPRLMFSSGANLSCPPAVALSSVKGVGRLVGVAPGDTRVRLATRLATVGNRYETAAPPSSERQRLIGAATPVHRTPQQRNARCSGQFRRRHSRRRSDCGRSDR